MVANFCRFGQLNIFASKASINFQSFKKRLINFMINISHGYLSTVKIARIIMITVIKVKDLVGPLKSMSSKHNIQEKF